MKTMCGEDCCSECRYFGNVCEGCEETCGHPCGGTCTAAEYERKNGAGTYPELERQIIEEINSLGIDGLKVDSMNLLSGAYVNLEYTLPNGQTVCLLDDKKIYLANQIERPGNERCYGVAADDNYLLVCEYGCEGADPEILVYKKI